MLDQAKPVSSPLRRSLRFSVRGLVVVVLVIGAGLGWLVRNARIQRDAVAVIERGGGGVSYDWDLQSASISAAGKPWAPSWLVDLVGIDYFGHVRLVGLFEATRRQSPQPLGSRDCGDCISMDGARR